MKTPEEVEKRITDLQKEYDELDRKNTNNMSISDMKDHYGQLRKINESIYTLKWVLIKREL